eukprot:257949_1
MLLVCRSGLRTSKLLTNIRLTRCCKPKLFALQIFFKSDENNACNNWIRYGSDETITMYDWPVGNKTQDLIISKDDDDIMMTYDSSSTSSDLVSTTENYSDYEYDEDYNKSYSLKLNILNDIYTNVCAKIIDNAESMMIYDWPHGYIKHNTLQNKCDYIDNKIIDAESMTIYDSPHGDLKLNI